MAKCHTLQTVGLTGTKITNEAVIQLVRGNPDIHYLHTDSCPVNHEQLAPIVKEHCSHIHYSPHAVPEWKNDPKYKNSRSAPPFDEHGLVFWLKAEDVTHYANIEVILMYYRSL